MHLIPHNKIQVDAATVNNRVDASAVNEMRRKEKGGGGTFCISSTKKETSCGFCNDSLSCGLRGSCKIIYCP